MEFTGPVKTKRHFFDQLGPTLALAFPMMIAQIGQQLMSVTDAVVLGHVGVASLAAVGFSNSVLSTLYVVGIGMLTSIGVFTSHAHGAGLIGEKAQVLRAALAHSAIVGVVVAGLTWSTLPLLYHIGIDSEVVKLSEPYLMISGISVIPELIWIGVKLFADACGRPTMPMAILYFGVALNAVLNGFLVLGIGGSLRLGLVGSSSATLIARTTVMILTIGYVRYFTRFRWREFNPLRATKDRLRSLLALGTPVSLQLMAEVGAFSFAAIMMGQFGTVPQAAHQIAISCAATTFMLPLGVSQAAAVRIGHAIGSGKSTLARRIGLEATVLSALTMGLMAALFVWFGPPIARLFSDSEAVVSMAASFLVVSGIFQIADGIQVTAAGGLRGLADVRVPMFISFICYWLVAIPAAYLIAFVGRIGPVGLWVGLALGLFLAALLLTVRFMFATQPGRTILGVVTPKLI